MSQVVNLMQNGGPVFLFSNENVTGALGQLDNLAGGRVLSVAASGDHAFTAYQMGAKTVDTFDANAFQRAVMDLKLFVIKNFPYETFKQFFLSDKNRFDLDLIGPSFDQLPPHVHNFLYLYRTHPGIVRGHGDCGRSARTILNNLGYLRDEKSYNDLRNKLPDQINFVHTDLDGIHETFTQKYDVVILSNIVDYACDFHSLRMDNFRKITRNNIYKNHLLPMSKNMLNQGGVVLFEYMWGESGESYEMCDTFQAWSQKKYRLLMNLLTGPENRFGIMHAPNISNHRYIDLIFTMRHHQR